jgi:hypothetical protein
LTHFSESVASFVDAIVGLLYNMSDLQMVLDPEPARYFLLSELVKHGATSSIAVGLGHSIRKAGSRETQRDHSSLSPGATPRTGGNLSDWRPKMGIGTSSVND